MGKPSDAQYLTIDIKKMHKSEAIGRFLGKKSSRKLVVRTMRARGVILKDLQPRRLNVSETEEDAEILKAGDLGGVLVRVGASICLAVVEPLNFKTSTSKKIVPYINYDELEEEATVINVQIVGLSPPHNYRTKQISFGLRTTSISRSRRAKTESSRLVILYSGFLGNGFIHLGSASLKVDKAVVNFHWLGLSKTHI
jgi:hypothetical protein